MVWIMHEVLADDEAARFQVIIADMLTWAVTLDGSPPVVCYVSPAGIWSYGSPPSNAWAFAGLPQAGYQNIATTGAFTSTFGSGGYQIMPEFLFYPSGGTPGVFWGGTFGGASSQMTPRWTVDVPVPPNNERIAGMVSAVQNPAGSGWYILTPMQPGSGGSIMPSAVVWWQAGPTAASVSGDLFDWRRGAQPASPGSALGRVTGLFPDVSNPTAYWLGPGANVHTYMVGFWYFEGRYFLLMHGLHLRYDAVAMVTYDCAAWGLWGVDRPADPSDPTNWELHQLITPYADPPANTTLVEYGHKITENNCWTALLPWVGAGPDAMFISVGEEYELTSGTTALQVPAVFRNWADYSIGPPYPHHVDTVIDLMLLTPLHGTAIYSGPVVGDGLNVYWLSFEGWGLGAATTDLGALRVWTWDATALAFVPGATISRTLADWGSPEISSAIIVEGHLACILAPSSSHAWLPPGSHPIAEILDYDIAAATWTVWPQAALPTGATETPHPRLFVPDVSAP